MSTQQGQALTVNATENTLVSNMEKIKKLNYMNSPQIKQGLASVSTTDCPILLLGSMPSEKSLLAQQYYAHPRNAFWKIMETITRVEWNAPYPERLVGLHSVGIALWDVVASCERQGSLDANITLATIQINAFAEFFATHPKIQWIGLNGSKASLLQNYISHHAVKAAV